MLTTLVELQGPLDFGPMTGACNLRHLGIAQRLFVGLDTSARNHLVAGAPHQQGGRLNPAQQMGQAGVVHVRLPAQARGLGTGVLEGLELFGGHLPAIDFGEFRRAFGIGHGDAQMTANRERKNVENLALRGLDSHRTDQDQATENSRVRRQHLRGDKTAGGKADRIHRIQFQFAHHLRIQAAQVAIVAHPVDFRGLAEARLQRDQQSAIQRQLFVPGHPARIAQLVVKDEQRLAAATFYSDQFAARRLDLLLCYSRQNRLLRLVSTCCYAERGAMAARLEWAD